MPEKAVLTQTHLIRYAPKEQDTWSVLLEMVAFKDPLTIDMGYLSSLGSSFVIEIQAHARRTGLERIDKTRRKLGRLTTVVAYKYVTLKPRLQLST